MKGQKGYPGYVAERNEVMTDFLIICFSMGVAGSLQKFFFSEAGENLTYDVRVLLFKSLIHKEVAWFDSKERAPGILTNILSEDITNLNGLTTETIGTAAESFASLAGGIAASAYYQWRMALVCLALTPFTVLGAVLMAKL